MTDAVDSMAADARWVINACVARGYEIGIATAGCRADYVKSYLSRRVDPDAWSPAILNSAAFQSCQPYKISSLPLVMAHYGVGNARGCGVLFDQGFNKGYADRTGLGFADVDIKTGLRAKDFAAAEAQFERNCPMTTTTTEAVAVAVGGGQKAGAPPPGVKL
jgi:hypothetical protein